MFHIETVLEETAAELARTNPDSPEAARLYAVRRIAERISELEDQIDIRMHAISELENELMAVI